MDLERKISIHFKRTMSLLLAIGVVLAAAPLWADAEWDKIVAAAKKEGKVSVIGPQGTETKDALTLAFQKKHPDIRIEFNGMSGSAVTAKVLNEQGARKYLVDVAVTGTTTGITGLLPANALIPIKTHLVGPNSRDGSAWIGKKFTFADNARQYVIVMSAYVKAPFIYNSELVDASTIKSWKDLLDPKWKGKLALRDPTRPGGGLGNATLWYITPSLGEEYIRQLFSQNPVVSGNDRQILDFVAKGKSPIGIGPSDVLTNELIGRGLPLKHFNPADMKEGTYITAGNGALVAMKNPPHPNAVKVYLDFLLSAEGQYEWSKGAGFASMRTDVPHDHVLDILVPKEGMTYPQLSDEEFVSKRDEVVKILRPLMRRR